MALSAKACARRVTTIMEDCERKLSAQLSSELAKGHITISQYHAILNLNKEGELTMSALARALCITTAAATSLVDNLIKQNLAVRRRSAEDRRVVKVSLTERGREVLNEAKDEVYHLILSIMEKLSPAERISWLDLYEKINSLIAGGNAK